MRMRMRILHGIVTVLFVALFTLHVIIKGLRKRKISKYNFYCVNQIFPNIINTFYLVYYYGRSSNMVRSGSLGIISFTTARAYEL